MEIRFAKASDIDRLMDLVRLVKDDFPGLETEESLKEHRDTVLRFIENRSARSASWKMADLPAFFCFRQRTESCVFLPCTLFSEDVVYPKKCFRL